MLAISHPASVAAGRVVDRLFARNASLFGSGRLWTLPLADQLRRRVAGQVHGAGETFDQRWWAALDRADDDTLLAAAELAYAHVLFASDLRAETKRKLVAGTLERRNVAARIPPVLDAALDAGIAPTGVAYKRLRLSQLRLLAEALVAWKSLPAGRRRTLLTDAWAFKAWLCGVPPSGGGPQREALLHLVHPDVFEPIVSPRIKRQIVTGFAGAVPAGVEDVDAALLAVRHALTDRHGAGFSFFDDAVAACWR